ncbi:hypothetical protein MNB_SV-15-1287 [hydrothermal vent metagenome]|uniref:Uncharacterized protein n=1 Tax=hydrothermal vent metagenome TaxID=652676 RepID=A0A1W1EKD1_9ZZZZ
MSEVERIEALEREIRELKGLNNDSIPTYSFSKIKIEDLDSLVELNLGLNRDIFNSWFINDIKLSNDIDKFLVDLIEKNKFLMKVYNEEDLKIKFISKLLNHIDFQSYENNFREFYELVISYKTDRFIFTGTTDFVVSKGFLYSQKPYFFIQEFKKSIKGSDPEPQLLAELISAVELNNETSIKGAYIVGAIWNFVILEKLGRDKYQYFVSENFDSSKIEDLKGIYRNLVFVKNEIIDKIKIEEKRK